MRIAIPLSPKRRKLLNFMLRKLPQQESDSVTVVSSLGISELIVPTAIIGEECLDGYWATVLTAASPGTSSGTAVSHYGQHSRII